jgi:hypothetical protein
VSWEGCRHDSGKKKKKEQEDWHMDQVVEHLPSKHEVLNSNHSTSKQQQQKQYRCVLAVDTLKKKLL